MLKHSTYFEGRVQSVGFERLGQRQSVGVIAAGEFRFDTGAPERMSVVSGRLEIKLDGQDAWQAYPAGTYFEVAGNSAFDVRAEGPTAYLCEYL